MTTEIRLEQYLTSQTPQPDGYNDLVSVLLAIADTGASLAQIISRRGQITRTSEVTEGADGAGMRQPLQLLAHETFVQALKNLPLSFIASDKAGEIIEIDREARLAVAIDPLDGSTNIETNTAIGTIFSVLSANSSSVFEKDLGDVQLAAGFLFYGPQTRMVITCGDGTHNFLLDPEDRHFYQVGEAQKIPEGQREFAINMSNYRFWDDNLRYFIDDCIAGENGPLGEDFNMRWNASLVAEAYRILTRGGVFLYPGDSRPGFESGRLRLLYEVLPLAFIIEQAGGLASDGSERILDMRLASLHKKVPMIFGSANRVREVIGYITGDALENTRFPLFENRSLFRN